MKDNFSTSSDNYAKYRPDYPQSIYDFIFPLLKEKTQAWDCGTGNGQVAVELAKEFQHVEASDLSQAQIDNAFLVDNIHYSKQTAENTNFKNDTFDLVTVAQAVHWFDFDKFYSEVKRVGKPGSVIAIMGYELNNITPELDAIVRHFYKNIIGEYWDPERRYLEQRYETIPFPFKELEAPEISNIKLWKLENLIGYLSTWSSVKHYMKKNGSNPLDEIIPDLEKAWGNQEVRKVNFPILFRVGRIK